MNLGTYARMSHNPDGSKEAALGRQLAENREWARLHGHEITAEYIDPADSAFKAGRREHFERMLADLDAGAIDGVIVWKLDRLVRNHSDFERFMEICSGRGALFAAVHDPIDTSSEVGLMIVRLLVGFARLESANNSLRTSTAMAESAKLGRLPGGGSRPFGYSHVAAVRDGAGKIVTHPTLAIVPEEAELIREAARRVLEEGASLTSIAHDWNREQVATPNGGAWYTSQVRRLLSSPRIAGLREHHGEVVAEGTWPPILDRQTWEVLRARIEGRALPQGRPHKYLLSGGLLRCGYCQQAMSGATHKSRGKIEYRCLPVPGPERCGKITVTAGPVDALVAEQVALRLDRYQPPAASNGQERELMAQLQADQARLVEVGQAFADGSIPRATMVAAVERLEQRIGATSRRLARTTTVVPVGGAQAIRQAWATRSMAWRRQLLRTVIDHVEVRPATVAGGPFDPARIRIVWAKPATSPMSDPS
jgi:DNA invertase Pin-like site-specific DNA recombinase